jgi:hypothetical protein
MSKEDVDLWFRINNLIPEKGELFFDFCYSLFNLMDTTYLGEETFQVETKVILTDLDKEKHFEWCWNTTISNFKKENLYLEVQGDHYNYFLTFFMEVYYKQKNEKVRDQISSFLVDLFDKQKTFTKSDLDLYTEMYKLLDRSIQKAE